MKQAEIYKHPVEIWGGVECSVVRINGTVHDQLKMNGHEERMGDLDLFADLGLRKLRYPLLWEKYISQKELFFELHDARLSKMHALGIQPIAGLLHHGSGPFDTDMLQEDFAERLAAYAEIIARKYPWIEYYTPVNEPLTTARFSGLYGIWFPHKKSDYAFAKMFLNELKGIVLSMQRIRRINPNAKLIQTEDIARVHSTPLLKSQADLENERTWLTYDILTGNFGREHAFWKYFINVGIKESDLEFFIDNVTPPHICGFNYYVTSERFLDHRIRHYPDVCIGGNDFHDYADVEVVRVGKQALTGIENLLRDACNRYELPVALTEIHLACSREEQLRWFNDAWKAVNNLVAEGYNVKAITAWSLLGSFDWNTLLQVKGAYYESGVFDIRSGKPRPTALAHLIKSFTLKQQASETSHLLEIPGWWKRDVRIKYIEPENLEKRIDNEYNAYFNVKPILLLGKGAMAIGFEKLCKLRGLPVISSRNLPIEALTEDIIIKLIQQYKPWAVINSASFSNIDEAELLPIDCYKENTILPRSIAQMCAIQGIRMLTFSSDQVFNGKKKQPYLEADETDPLNVYGMSKKLAEESILNINPQVLIIRSGLLLNPFNSDDFLIDLLFRSSPKQKKYIHSDIIVSPAYLPDLINTALDLLIDKETGIWHISGPEAVSYFDFARMAQGISGINELKIESVPSIRLATHALRPTYSVLKSASGITLPSLESSINAFLAEVNYR